MTPEEKRILLKEIPKYIKENCYYTDGSIKHYDLWLVGWVAANFEDRRNAANDYYRIGHVNHKITTATPFRVAVVFLTLGDIYKHHLCASKIDIVISRLYAIIDM